MTPPADSSALAPVLDELGWLRSLARELCTDAHAADDAVQETMAAALRRPPDQRQSVRAWLRTVLTNALRLDRRRLHRRRQREFRLAAAEATASAAELAERVELQRLLLDEVHRLREPLRATVALRFLEDLPPRRIAALQQVPVATVKDRLRRALAELRQRLDARHDGDRRTWVLALAALEPLIGTMAMNKLLVGGGALIALLALVCVPLFSSDPVAAPPEPAGGGAGRAMAATASTAERTTDAAMPAERTALATPPAATGAAADAPRGFTLDGLLVDCDGRPLAGLAVVGASDGAATTTDAQGQFALQRAKEGTWLRVAEPGWSTVFAGADRPGVRRRVVVAAPTIALAGQIVDEAGLPVASVDVAVEFAESLRSRIAVVLDESNAEGYHARTDAAGAFAFEVPAVVGAALQAEAAGYVDARQPLPTIPDRALRMVLRRPHAAQKGLSGRVLDAQGAPAADALVTLGSRAARTDADGAFTLDMAKASHLDDGELVAIKAGALPARLRAAAAAPRFPEPLVLQLGGPTLAIAGRVLAADGAPGAGVRVWVNRLELVGSDADGDMLYLENRLRGVPNGWQPVRTDADGRFRIDGLVDRSYHVTAIDDATALRVDREDVPAGTSDLELPFDPAELIAELHGRVVDRDGNGLVGIDVRATTDAYEQYFRGYPTGVWHETGSSAVTAADGAFTLHDVPRRRTYLRFSGEQVLPDAYGKDDANWIEAGGDLLVTLVRRCHFQVELLHPDEADHLKLLDANGRDVTLTQFQAGGSMSSNLMPITDGRSAALAAGENADTMVLLQGAREVRRIPIRLVAGELTTLRY